MCNKNNGIKNGGYVLLRYYSFQCVVTSHTSTSYPTLCDTGSSTHGAVGGGCMVADLTSFTARQEKEQLKEGDTKPVIIMSFYWDNMLQPHRNYCHSRLEEKGKDSRGKRGRRRGERGREVKAVSCCWQGGRWVCLVAWCRFETVAPIGCIITT